MHKGKSYSYFLVSLQFVLIIFLAITSDFKNNAIYLSIFTIGVFWGLWAIIVMQKSKLRITPDVAKNASLVENGPYRYIRHPMYFAVLTTCFALMLSNINLMTVFFYILLLAVLFSKINYEEKLLKKAFSEYKNYQEKTKKLIPLLY